MSFLPALLFGELLPASAGRGAPCGVRDGAAGPGDERPRRRRGPRGRRPHAATMASVVLVLCKEVEKAAARRPRRASATVGKGLAR